MSTTNVTFTGIRAGNNPISVNFSTEYKNSKEAKVTYKVTVNGGVQQLTTSLNEEAPTAQVNLNGLSGTLRLQSNSAISFTGNLLWSGMTELVIEGSPIIAMYP